MKSAKRVSSNPTTDNSCGTLIPSSNACLITPIAVISLEQRSAVGAFPKFAELLKSPFSAFQPVVSLDDELGPHRQADLTHRPFERIFSRYRGPQFEGSTHETDPLMPQGRQMLHGLANSMGIVDTDVADAGSLWANIHKYQGHISETEMLQQLVFHPEGKYCNAVDSSSQSSCGRQVPCAWGHESSRSEESRIFVRRPEFQKSAQSPGKRGL